MTRILDQPGSSEATKLRATDVLLSLMQHDTQALRQFLHQQPGHALFGLLVRLVGASGWGVKSLVRACGRGELVPSAPSYEKHPRCGACWCVGGERHGGAARGVRRRLRLPGGPTGDVGVAGVLVLLLLRRRRARGGSVGTSAAGSKGGVRAAAACFACGAQVREFTDGAGDGGLCEQVAELLKLLLDPETMKEKAEKSGARGRRRSTAAVRASPPSDQGERCSGARGRRGMPRRKRGTVTACCFQGGRKA